LHNQQNPAIQTIGDSRLLDRIDKTHPKKNQTTTTTPKGKTQSYKTLVADIRRNTWRDDIMIFKLNNKTKQHQKTHGCVASLQLRLFTTLECGRAGGQRGNCQSGQERARVSGVSEMRGNGTRRKWIRHEIWTQEFVYTINITDKTNAF
jgi:hypothetical protein